MKSKAGKIVISVLMMLISVACIMVTSYNIITNKKLDLALTVFGAALFLVGTLIFFRAVKMKKA